MAMTEVRCVLIFIQLSPVLLSEAGAEAAQAYSEQESHSKGTGAPIIALLSAS